MSTIREWKNKLRYLIFAFLVVTASCTDESDDTLTNTNPDGASSEVQVDAAPVGDANRNVDAAVATDAVPGADAFAKDASADAPLAASEVAGYYSGQWGDMVLRVVGDEIWGAYTHDDGTIVGRYVDGVFVGWWSEVPSRMPNADAGDVEFRFTRVGNVVRMDGRWRYGTAEAWREDWDIDQVSGDEPANLVLRFATPEAFVRHP